MWDFANRHETLCGIGCDRRNFAKLTRLDFGMSFYMLQRPLRHLFLSLVGKQRRSIFQLYPTGARHFDSHLGRNIVDPSGAILHQVKADDLEDALAVAPR